MSFIISKQGSLHNKILRQIMGSIGCQKNNKSLFFPLTLSQCSGSKIQPKHQKQSLSLGLNGRWVVRTCCTCDGLAYFLDKIPPDCLHIRKPVTEENKTKSQNGMVISLNLTTYIPQIMLWSFRLMKAFLFLCWRLLFSKRGGMCTISQLCD